MTGVVYDPYSTEIHHDPYPILSRLRAEAPVYHNQEHRFWAASRYEDVAAVSLDWENFTTSLGSAVDLAGSSSWSQAAVSGRHSSGWLPSPRVITVSGAADSPLVPRMAGPEVRHVQAGDGQP